MSGDSTRGSDPIDISDGVCAYLQGGLGNQLFILAAAWAQARRLDCPLYIDRSRFVRRDRLEIGYETARDFDLAQIQLPGIVLAENSPWYANSPRRPAALRRPGRRSRALAVFREPDSGGPMRIDDEVRPGTTLLGYFQSPLYFSAIAEDVRALVEGAAFSTEDTAGIASARDRRRLTVHLRRGDYLRPEVASHHGVASTAYVERALRVLHQLTGGREALVYTDSPEVVAGELSGLDGTEIVEPSSLGTLATIVAMSQGTGFVMSNSSFSWWGAYLMHTGSGAPVIAPRPWLASGAAAADLLVSEWLTIGAR